MVFDGSREVARHQRVLRRGGQALDLDHYLEIVTRKPGALAGSTPLAQARARGLFTAAHQAFWDRARAAHGDGAGTRALIEVLLTHRHAAHADVVTGIEVALAAGSTSPELVAIETRKAASTRPSAASTAPQAAPVAATAASVRELPTRPRRVLPADARPAPNLAAYDQLLLFDRREPAS